MCTACAKVTQINAFRKKVVRQRNKTSPQLSISNMKVRDFLDTVLTAEQKATRLKKLRAKYRSFGMKIRRLKSRLKRSSAKLQNVADIGSEYALRGDTKALSKTLKMAYDKGTLSNKAGTIAFLQNLIENINKKPKGKG